MFRIENITCTGAMADRVEYMATTTYLDDGSVSLTRFVGPTTPGYPGPTFVMLEGWDWIRVDDPARFGDDFGPDWIRQYFAD